MSIFDAMGFTMYFGSRVVVIGRVYRRQERRLFRLRGRFLEDRQKTDGGSAAGGFWLKDKPKGV
ncbi:MAG: hypothetical protein P8165_07230 [Deltaproteobacteria bacterium]